MFNRKGRSRSRPEDDNNNNGSPDGLGLDVLYPRPPSRGSSANNTSSDRDVIVDIVFVHGLGGSRYGTWKKNGVLWPKSLLSEDFPRARILTVRFFVIVVLVFAVVVIV